MEVSTKIRLILPSISVYNLGLFLFVCLFVVLPAFQVLRSVVLDSQYCYRTLSSFSSNSVTCPGLFRGYFGVGEQEQEKPRTQFQVLQDEQEL